MVAHPNGDTVARGHSDMTQSHDHRPGTFQDEPVLVAVMIVRIETGIPRIADRISLGQARSIRADREKATPAQLRAPPAAEQNDLAGRVARAERPSRVIAGAIGKLPFAKNLGAWSIHGLAGP